MSIVVQLSHHYTNKNVLKFDRPAYVTKRRELIAYIVQEGAVLLREGRRHSIYGKGKYRTQIPRHTEIVDELAKKICRDLNIPFGRQPK